MINVQFNSAELLRKLQDLNATFQRKSMISALRAAAKPMTQELKRNAPKKTGLFKKSIGTGVPRPFSYNRLGVKPHEFAVISGSTKKVDRGDGEGKQWQIKLAIWLEQGTTNKSGAPHIRKRLMHVKAQKNNEGKLQPLFFGGLQKYINKISA